MAQAVRRIPTWAVFAAVIVTAGACFISLSGIVQAGSFAVSGPIDTAVQQAAYWHRVQQWWLIGLAVSVPGFVASCIGLYRRSWRRVRPAA